MVVPDVSIDTAFGGEGATTVGTGVWSARGTTCKVGVTEVSPARLRWQKWQWWGGAFDLTVCNRLVTLQLHYFSQELNSLSKKFMYLFMYLISCEPKDDYWIHHLWVLLNSPNKYLIFSICSSPSFRLMTSRFMRQSMSHRSKAGVTKSTFKRSWSHVHTRKMVV